MKTQCLQTNEMQHYFRKENASVAGWGREKVALIKSLITWDRKEALEAWLQKIELNLSADIADILFSNKYEFLSIPSSVMNLINVIEQCCFSEIKSLLKIVPVVRRTLEFLRSWGEVETEVSPPFWNHHYSVQCKLSQPKNSFKINLFIKDWNKSSEIL